MTVLLHRLSSSSDSSFNLKILNCIVDDSRVKVVAATFLSYQEGERENKRRSLLASFRIATNLPPKRGQEILILFTNREREDEDEFSSSKGDDTTDQSDLQILAKQV